MKKKVVSSAGLEPVRSFCARVMILCYEVEGAVSLTLLKSLKTMAERLRKEAEVVQSLYGGHPGKPPKLDPLPPPVKTKKKR